MVTHPPYEASGRNNEVAGGGDTGTLQLLWSKRKFPRYTALLEISEILHLPNAELP